MQSETKYRIFEEIDRICYDKPEEDRENAKAFVGLIDSVPVVEMTNHGVCLTWKRMCVVFENEELYYYRYTKDCSVTYKNSYLYEDCFDFGFINMDNEKHLERCREEANRV